MSRTGRWGTSVLMGVAAGLATTAITAALRSRVGTDPSEDKGPFVVGGSGVGRVDEFGQALIDARSRSRRLLVALASFTFGIGVLHVVLAMIASGPEANDGTLRVYWAATRDAGEAMAELGNRGGVELVLAMFAAQAVLAIALTTTKVERDATPQALVDTERWMSTLRVAGVALAAAVCFTSAGAVLASGFRGELPPDTVLMLVIGALACGLASGAADRSDSLVVQTGIQSQIDRLGRAEKVLAEVEQGSPAAFWRWSICPVAIVFGLDLVRIGVAHDFTTFAGRAAVYVVVLVWLAVGLGVIRHGTRGLAFRWAIGAEWRGVVLIGASALLIVVAVAFWMPLAYLLSYVISSTYWPGLLVILSSPVVRLVIDGSPRIHRSKTLGPDGPRVVPSGPAAGAAKVRLERRRSALGAELRRWQERAEREEKFEAAVSKAGPSAGPQVLGSHRARRLRFWS